jgi:hypothetical protein
MGLAYDIAHALSNGKPPEKNGDGFTCRCPAHGDKRNSLSIKDDGHGGVIVHCFTGCDHREVKDTMRSMGLLPEWVPDKEKAKNKMPSTKKQNTKPQEEKPSYIWKQATKEGLENAKKYFATRAINIDPLPVCIRWNSYTDKRTGEDNNMVVFAASKPDDTTVYAVQRIFIDMETHKKTGAKMHGICEGRGIWFDRKGNMKEILVGEGIENTLSAMQVTGKSGVASLSWAGMKNLIIPEDTYTVYILVDSDQVKTKEAVSLVGQKAAHSLAERFTTSREGNQAYLVTPDDTCFSDNPNKLDFNDLLKADPSGGTIRARFAKAKKFENLDWEPPETNQDTQKNTSGQYPEDTLLALHKMNKEYAAVLLSGTFRVVKEGFDNIAQKHSLDFMLKQAFWDYYSNTKVAVYLGPEKNVGYKELGKVWISWEGRRTYGGVVFDPSEKTPSDIYNLFKGFPLIPQKGDWSKMRKHIFQVICSGNTEHFKYLLAWMARAVQEPGGDKPGVAIVLKGGKGIGKGVFTNYFGAIFGEAFLPIADSESFTGRFNMHLSKSLLVFLDEAVWGGDKKAEGKLKQLITEPTVLFEPKGIDSLTMRNFINVIIASNEDWVIPATGDERRYLVLEPSSEFQQNTKYFGEIVQERNNGGAEAMMYDLLNYDFSDVNLRKAPVTKGLADQIRASLPPTLDFWFSVLDRGYILSDKETGSPRKTDYHEDDIFIDQFWPQAVFKHEIYGEYSTWCRSRNVRHICAEPQFWKAVVKVWPCKDVKQRRASRADGRVSIIDIPDLDLAKAAFSETTRIDFNEHDEADSGLLPFHGQF